MEFRLSRFGRRIWVIILAAIVTGVLFGAYTLYQLVTNTEKTMTSYVPAGHYPEYPVLDLKGKTRQQISEIMRGEYLVKAGDCIACHTAPAKDSRPFAGGLPFQTPFGVLYSPNITPDKETGIGGWDDADFIRALHDGIAPDGSYYYPAFPYLYFNQITTPDVMAIKAYLDSVPAVKQRNLNNDMMFPFNWRFTQLGWRILFFYSHQSDGYQYDGKQSDQWNIGKYYVEGLGHCAMCHTPSYYIVNKNVSLGAPIRKYSLTGADIEGYLAPNISKSNLGAIPDAEVLKVFKQYRMLGGNPVQGPMKDAVHDSLVHMKTSDLLAMIAYLKTVDSEIPRDINAAVSDMGRSVYNNYCSGCHNAGIAGAPRFGDAASWNALANSGMQKLYDIAINGGGNMPAKGTCLTCSDFEIELAVDYIVAKSRVAAKAPLPEPSSPQAAKTAYDNYCSACHSNTKSDAPQLGDKRAWAPVEERGFLAAYRYVVDGKYNHPVRCGDKTCSDQEVIAALKYMLQKGSSKKRDYQLW